MSQPHPIQKYIEAEGLSVVDFAKKIGIDRVSVYRIIRGAQRPSPKTAEQIVAATGGKITFNDLYSQAAA